MSAPLTVRKCPPQIHRHSASPAESVLVPFEIGRGQESGWTCFVISTVPITVLFWRCTRRLSDPLPYVTNEDAL